MMLSSITDFGAGLTVLVVAVIAGIAIPAALAGRYFRWCAAKDPAGLDRYTQMEFDWCWNMSALVLITGGVGLLWALDAINAPFSFNLDYTFINGYWILALALLIDYVCIYGSTGRTRPSRNAVLVYVLMTLAGLALGQLVAAGLVSNLQPSELASIYGGSSNVVNPYGMLSAYGLMGWFFAPDFDLFLIVTFMAPLLLGFVVSQIIQGIVNVVKIPAEKAFPLRIPRREDDAT